MTRIEDRIRDAMQEAINSIDYEKLVATIALHIGKEYPCDEIFSLKDLEGWAASNGWIKEIES